MAYGHTAFYNVHFEFFILQCNGEIDLIRSAFTIGRSEG
jgi:hypothetical protein